MNYFRTFAVELANLRNPMEQKKSAGANLDARRSTSFLLGIVVVLSAMFVALEWNSSPDDYDIDERMLEDIAEEMLISPWEEKEQDMTVVEEKAQPKLAERIEVVDVAEEIPQTEEEDAPMAISSEQEDAGLAPALEEPLPQPEKALEESPGVRIVEKMPEFPGGISAFIQWLSRNLKYPPQAAKQKRAGRVVVAFIVNADGTITGERILHSADPLFDAEAMRVVRMMPKWTPGIDKGKHCRTMVAVPIVFEP